MLRAYDRNLHLKLEAHSNILAGLYPPATRVSTDRILSCGVSTNRQQGSLPTASHSCRLYPLATRVSTDRIFSCGVSTNRHQGSLPTASHPFLWGSTNRLQVSLPTHISCRVSTDCLQVDRGTDEYYCGASTNRLGIICHTYKLNGITN